MKALLVILDGVGDIGKKTPLSTAKKPTMDRLAKEGVTGLLHPLGRGKVPTSDLAHLALFGYGPEYAPGRGPFEALGADLKLSEGDIALRCNLATVRNGKLIDRRAGRNVENAGKIIGAIGDLKIGDVEAKLTHTTQHRCVLVLRGPFLSSKISDTDPHKTGVPIRKSRPLDKTDQAKKTAKALNAFTKQSFVIGDHPLNKHRKLPANSVICRGAGTYMKVPTLREKYGISAACVAGGALYRGVAKYVGMDIIHVPGAEASFDTNLLGKAKAVLQSIKKHDLVFLHIKDTDNAGHDGDFQRKTQMIEKVDKMLHIILPNLTDTFVILTGDHSTPVSLMRHTSDPVPILFHGPSVTPDDNGKFDELSCQDGGLGHVEGLDVMPRICDFLGKDPTGT